MKKNILTYTGYLALKNELDVCTTTKRIEIAKLIKEAREQGDLSENTEYAIAKEAQSDNENRIREILDVLNNMELVESDDDDEAYDKVSIGCTVTLHASDMDETETYSIVGSAETDSLAGKISCESPVGKALLGSSVGDIVTAKTPSGQIAIKVLNIAYNPKLNCSSNHY